MDIVIALVTIACALAIGLYATWLFVERLRRGQSKGRSFGEWLKNIFQAVWGL